MFFSVLVCKNHSGDLELLSVELIAYTFDPDVVLTGWQSLKKLLVASMKGLIHVNYRINENHLEHIQLLTNAEQAFKLLRHNRVDVVILPKLLGDIFIFQPPNFNVYQTIIEKLPVYHFLHRRHVELVAPLAKQLSDSLFEAK